jgi:hypothetical protein
MISKFLKASSFYHTCRYICQKKGSEVLFVEGVRGHDFKLMAEDFQRQQQTRPGKEKAGAHIILSFHPDDKPSDELMQEIAAEYLARTEILNTQVAIVKHTDTKHPHLHLVVNMVDNDGNAIPDSWIGLRGKKVSQELTQEYGLIPAIQKNLNQTNLQALNEAEATKYEIYQVIKEILPRCKTMELLEFHLLLRGIETKYKYKGQTKEKQGISFKKGRLSFKGSEISREFSLGNLQRKFALRPDQAQKPKSGLSEKAPDAFEASQRRGLPPSTPTLDKKPSYDRPTIAPAILQIIAEGLKPVHSGGGGPYYSYLSEEERKKKRKKKRRGL